MNYMKLVALITTLSISATAPAAEWHKINGTYAITAKDMVSPVEDSHLRIQLKGQSARDLFNAMKVKQTLDECTGGMAKTVDEMQCLYFSDSNNYQCYFAIDVMQQKIEFGVNC